MWFHFGNDGNSHSDNSLGFVQDLQFFREFRGSSTKFSARSGNSPSFFLSIFSKFIRFANSPNSTVKSTRDSQKCRKICRKD